MEERKKLSRMVLRFYQRCFFRSTGIFATFIPINNNDIIFQLGKGSAFLLSV
jgi:hypothetical protein